MGKHHVVATIYDKAGNVLAKASNNYTKSHPVQAKFAREVGQPDRIYMHAEIAALTRLSKRDRPSPYKIVIERRMKNGMFGLAKPCPVCQAAIQHWGIERVEYTL